MTKRVSLTRGKHTLVDDADYALVQQYRWRYLPRRGGRSTGYAATHIKRDDGSYKTVEMQRLLLDPPEGFEVDHINRNGLDNRRSNLRLCTHSQNMANRAIQPHNTSGYIGIEATPRQSAIKWVARIRHRGSRYYLGTFNTKEEAALAYDEAARELHGEFAVTNF